MNLEIFSKNMSEIIKIFNDSYLSMYYMQLLISAFLIVIPVMFAAISITLLSSKFMDTVARQPETLEPLTSRLITLAGIIEAVPIISIGVALLILLVNPAKFSVLDNAKAALSIHESIEKLHTSQSSRK